MESSIFCKRATSFFLFFLIKANMVLYRNRINYLKQGINFLCKTHMSYLKDETKYFQTRNPSINRNKILMPSKLVEYYYNIRSLFMIGRTRIFAKFKILINLKKISFKFSTLFNLFVSPCIISTKNNVPLNLI